MFELRPTEEFTNWLKSLRDRRAAVSIAKRLLRLESGRMGDVKFFDGLGEIRIDHGPGYRVYFVQRGRTIIILLCGGDKSTQRRDIERARIAAKEY
jgi:putative addiction module killer protein